MNASVGGPAPAPNWYPDPSDPRFLRYWDGARWTEHTSPVSGEVAGAPQGGVAPSGGSSHKVLWIVLGVVGGLMALGVIVVVVLAAIAAPVYDSQRQKAADTSAKADVATLGMEISVWYVDHDGPPPSVEVHGGDYWVDGVRVATTSENVILGTVSGTGTTDWCVWVTNPKGDLKDFEYSAQRGLAQGTC